ncbi:hypothetical protein CMZ84_13540 [Lysobacteraceae bacterium NML93-0399]|nr:hypothetical protein CMZ84_13540 [Xanthomonadaceae bacterium NML93-0399]
MLAGAALACTLSASLPASADTLLVDRAKQPAGTDVPTRGMSMADVEARFGVPSERLDPRGGEKRQWPTINRWVYPTFTVYFERNRVIDTVANRATASEIGPKPAIR